MVDKDEEGVDEEGVQQQDVEQEGTQPEGVVWRHFYSRQKILKPRAADHARKSASAVQCDGHT